MTDKRPELVKLEENLSRISDLALKTDPQKMEEVLELADLFDQWTSRAKKEYGPWMASLVLQSNQIVKGLRSGRPSHQGLERLLKALLDAGYLLKQEEEKKPEAQKPGSDVLFFDVETKPEGAATVMAQTLSVKEADLPGFTDFLQEAPPYFNAVENGLLHMEQSGNWDPLSVYRSFHTLKSLFGYLGFQKMSDLAHLAENLLEPFKKNNQGKLNGEQAGILLKVVDLFREQVRKIQEGLPKGVIEIFPVQDLFEGTSQTLPPAAESPTFENTEKPVDAAPEEQDQFIRVGVEKMDGLMETLEEWSVYHNKLRLTAQELGFDETASEILQGLGKAARSLQDQVLSLRMVPVQPLFMRIGRVARDISKKTGKPLQLHLEGGSTELDKRLVDELWEAILHLVRNAVDHGLETPSERAQAGKSPYGNLKVRASHQGGYFILTLEDDGRGLDLSKIEKKAKKLGWLMENERLEETRLHEFIFRPGFSTQEEATDVSGRGIGLNVVRGRLQTLKGTVQVASEPGKGCLFTLRVPLTLAIMEGVLVRAGRGLYLVPINQINRFQNEFPTVGEKREPGDDASAPEEWVPKKVDLTEWFGGSPEANRQSVSIRLGEGDRQILLTVDEIIGKREVVLKGLDGLLEDLPGVNGGALLGDGRVCLVLDIQALLREFTLPSGRVS